jgi:hypothetical protein
MYLSHCLLFINSFLQHREFTEESHEGVDGDLSDADDGSDQPFMVSMNAFSS